MDNKEKNSGNNTGCLTVEEQIALMEMDAFSLYLNTNYITNRWHHAYMKYGPEAKFAVDLEQAMYWCFQQTQRFGVNDWTALNPGEPAISSCLIDYWNDFYEKHLNSLPPTIREDILTCLANNLVVNLTLKPEYLPQDNWQSIIPKEKS